MCNNYVITPNRNCRKSLRTRTGKVLFCFTYGTLLCVAVVELALFAHTIPSIFLKNADIPYRISRIILCVLYLLISFALLWLSVYQTWFETRKFALTEEGITVSLKGKQMFIPWSGIGAVYVCAHSHNTGMSTYNKEILLVLSPYHINPLSFQIKHGTLCRLQNMHRLIVIDYTDEVELEIKNYYTGIIENMVEKQLKGSFNSERNG